MSDPTMAAMSGNFTPAADLEAAKIREAAAGMLVNPEMQAKIDADLATLAGAAKAERRAHIEKLKNKLARARVFAGQAEAAYGEKYLGLIEILDAARTAWEKDHSLVIAENDRAKAAAEKADKELRAELVAYYNATKEKKIDEHLSVRVTVKLAYELEKATDWAKTNAPYMLIADKSQFEKHAKDKKVSLDFVTKTEDPSGVIATALPVIEDAQIDEQGAGNTPAERPGKWVLPVTGENEQGAG